MKRKLIFILSAVICAIMMVSCFEDKSTYPKPSDDMEIDPEGAIPDPIIVGYRETLHVDPQVIIGDGMDLSDLSFTWEVNQTANNKNLIVISKERVLDVVLENPVISGFYTLVFTVKDNNTGNMAQKSWLLNISSFAGGIVVAETRDGSTSDISLIMDKLISVDYVGDLSIRYGLNEAVTGEPLPALIRSVNFGFLGSTTSVHYNTVMTVLENDQMLYFNCNDYSKGISFSTTINMNGVNQTIEVPLELTSSNLFPGQTDSTPPTAVYHCSQNNFLLAGEQLYAKSSGVYNNVAFMVPETSEGSNHVDNSIISTTIGPSDAAYFSGPQVVWYDNTVGKIYQWMFMAGCSPLTDNNGFDPANLPNRRAKAGGISVDCFHHSLLLKNTSTGNYEIYLIQEGFTDWSYISHPMTTKPVVNVPQAVTNAIDESVACIFSKYEPVLFVVTDREIIAVNYADHRNVTHSVKYSASAGETISDAMQFIECGFLIEASRYSNDPTWVSDFGYKPIFPLTANALVVGVQESEYSGKVLVIPQINRGSGDLDATNITTYTGFGKILDLTVTQAN